MAGTAFIIPDINLSGYGLLRVMPPVPVFDNQLAGCWLFGSAWDGADDAGSDWSGNALDASVAGCTIGATSVTPTAAAYPLLPIKPNDLLNGGQQMTIMIVVTVPAGTVTTVPLIAANEGGASPYVQLLALPGADTVRAQNVTSSGNAQGDYLYTAADVELHATMYHCRWDNAAMKVKPGVVTGGIVKNSDVTVAYAGTGNGYFRLARTASAAFCPVHACFAYHGALTDSQIVEVYAAFKELAADYGLAVA
ncbi:hypothetical protein [Agrobacterium pusense]|uniref:Uncharacterized protein n=1 Tax=Agrobacterium pusense TaxID=648995 RepID=A0AA44EJ19_9HYPH|nr:hypothetical protein [Agrobacterium pusense]NRF09386.1 hypothetical protein [Agrobacterium pusense]NRF19709.1 hypothetical protein [Agrobacterium pusense]